MKFHVLTLFPEMIMNGLNTSILGKAAQKGLISFDAINFREYTLDKHGKVDDYPYGGGAGMLIQAQPVFDAYSTIVSNMEKKPRTIYLTPQGRRFDQAMAKELAKEEELVFLCGHYEGVDERVLEEIVTDYVSIGDYVLTGGELPVMVMIDAISRMIPGVLNNDISGETESFHNDLLEYPQYTRPEVWHDKPVPEILLSGNHKNISKWRLEQSEERTRKNRPDLYQIYSKKQEVMKHLLKKKRLFIHMIEALKRGIGNLIYESGNNIVIACEEVLMLCGNNEQEALIMLHKVFEDKPQYLEYEMVTMQKFMNDILEENFDVKVRMKCTQACYTRNVSLPVKYKNIRTLGIPYAEEIWDNYKLCSESYIRRRLEAGAVLGAFDEETLIGFIGMHAEGSMGMLFVKDAYRGRGVASALESYLINQQISRGEIPYCQISEGNTVSISLQERLGLYLSDGNIWWLHK